jgi:uncharacterized membrane protein
VTKAVGRDVALIMVGESSIDAAENDWKRLHDAEFDQSGQLYDLAVLGKNAEGDIAVLKDMHHKVRRGTLIGAVVALVTPVGLAAGLIGGAVSGKVGNHLHKGMSEEDKRALAAALERNSIMLIALADAALADPIKAAVTSTDVHTQTTTTTEAEFDKLLAKPR